MSRRMPRRMRGLLTPVSVSVIGFVGGIPPCGAAYFAPGGKAGKAPPGDAPGGTTAPHAFRLSPAVRFPPDPRYGRRGPLAWRPCPAQVVDDTHPPVCAAAAGVLNWRAYPTRVSRLPWQNRGGRWETSGRAKRARRFTSTIPQGPPASCGKFSRVRREPGKTLWFSRALFLISFAHTWVQTFPSSWLFRQASINFSPWMPSSISE